MLKEYGICRKLNKPLLFCSRAEACKRPLGAGRAGEKITLNFPVKESIMAERVFMVIRNADNSFQNRLELIHTGVYDGYDRFTLSYTLEKEDVYFYRFEIEKDERLLFVGRGENGEAVMGDWLSEWQQSIYAANYKTPDYIKGGIIYHIFADRFAKFGDNGKPPYGVLKNWNEDITVADPDGCYRANDFYGGNLKGITAKLDYLAELGVSVIYLSPIFKAFSNHRYDTGDYFTIDPLLGSEEDFKELIYQSNLKGIAIMLDGVFNHTGSDSLYFNKDNHYPTIGAYQSKDSPYYDWYTFEEFPERYNCWWGVTNVPTIKRDCLAFQELIAGENGVIEKWTRLGVKGWRLDVVDEISSSFVEKIRSKVKEINPEAVVIGEVWEDASTKISYGERRRYFFGKQLDGVMNYVFKESIIEFLLSADSKRFLERITEIIENYPADTLACCMTLIGSHDTVRIMNELSGADVTNMDKTGQRDYRLSEAEYALAKKRLFLAVCLQYFLPGVPTVYYGDDIGMQGFCDPINRRPYGFEYVDGEIRDFYIKLGALRRKHRRAFIEPMQIKESGGEITIFRDSLILRVNAYENKYDIFEKII